MRVSRDGSSAVFDLISQKWEIINPPGQKLRCLNLETVVMLCGIVLASSRDISEMDRPYIYPRCLATILGAEFTSDRIFNRAVVSRLGGPENSATSSDLTGEPSWNFPPERSLKVTALPSALVDQSSALWRPRFSAWAKSAANHRRADCQPRVRRCHSAALDRVTAVVSRLL